MYKNIVQKDMNKFKALFYRYEWWKNVNGKNIPVHPSTNQALIEYQEEMIMPLGSALTLGKIEVCFRPSLFIYFLIRPIRHQCLYI